MIHDIDHDVHVLKRHLPYHESDHVLNIAFNILAGGRRLEHIELRRNDEVFLDALGAQRIPDPTTAGDFCRRFTEPTSMTLMDTINETRLRVWAQQPAEFFEEAFLDADGTIVPTDAECKQGVDIAYDGDWGYHPLLISLANTAEPLYLVNRSGNRPSHEQATSTSTRPIALVPRGPASAGSLLRGDTDFSQTKHLDRWDQRGRHPLHLRHRRRRHSQGVGRALPAEAYSLLKRPPRYAIKTAPRQQPERVKEEIVRERGFETIQLLEEMVAEFEYRPVACKKSYRVIVLRKRLGIDKGSVRLFEEYRYFFYITNDRDDAGRRDRLLGQRSVRSGEPDRAAQERRARADDAGGRPGEQLGVHGDGLVGVEPEGVERAADPGSPRHAAKHGRRNGRCCGWSSRRSARRSSRCRARSCGSGRRLIYRLLSWNPWQGVFLRLVERLHGCWLC